MKVNAKGAIAALERVVKLKGEDYIAERCEIFNSSDADRGLPKTPVCIVGYVLHDLVGDGKFQSVEGGYVDQPAASVGVKLTPAAEDILRAAQVYQDGANHGYVAQPWGDALAYAKEAALGLDKED